LRVATISGSAGLNPFGKTSMTFKTSVFFLKSGVFFIEWLPASPHNFIYSGNAGLNDILKRMPFLSGNTKSSGNEE
jgi:hypothetical protein